MLHLFSSLYASVFKDVEFNVLIVGQEASGKSTLLEQVKFMYSLSNPPTTDAPAATTASTTTAISDSGLGELKGNLRKSLDTASNASPASASTNGTTTTTTTTSSAAPSRVVTMPAGPGGAVKNASPSSRSSPGASFPGDNAENTRSRLPVPVALPPGTPVPATRSYLDGRRIRPTVGMNYAKITHYFAPLAAVVETAPAPSPALGVLGSTQRASLPPPPSRTQLQGVPLYAAPSSKRTQLTFWDLGGQASLRPLWRNYFSQCHGVIFVVDSSAFFAAEAVRHGDVVSFLDTHATDRELLARLFQDPLLSQVPILIFCNKCDEPRHLDLATMQDALDLVGIAMQTPFYAASETRTGAVSGGGADEGKVAVSAKGDRAVGEELAFSGAGGFGNRLFRLFEGSAMSGQGVAAGLDWLVSQLLREGRTLATEE